MPRNSIRPRHNRRTDLSALESWQRRRLEVGDTFFPDQEFATMDDMRAAWELHGAAITEEWLRRHPGTRPYAAWLFDLIPQFGERLTTKHWHESYRASHLTDGVLHTNVRPPLQESEAEYLARHGLLTEAELAAIGTIVPACEAWEAYLAANQKPLNRKD